MSSAVLQTLEILDLRHYSSGDLRPLLESESRLWAAAMSWDYSGSVEMILRYIDSRILPGYVATEGGRICGYSFFVYEGSKGVIGDLFADTGDPVRDDRIRRNLLTHVIETLEQTPGIQRIEAQLLVHDTGALTEPFLHNGFHANRRLFMELPLPHFTGPAPAPADIELRPWQESDFQAASYVITAAYSGHVDATINDQYRTANGSLRFLNNIVRFPGCGVFDASSSMVAIHRYTGALIGLLLCSRVRKDVGHVTQICLLPEYRGRRLGGALLHACCNDLQSRGFTRLSLTVTEANQVAVELYRSLGFDTLRVFDAFVWEGN